MSANDFAQAYLYGYQYMTNVFTGTLTPRNVTNGFGPFSNVSYRIVDALQGELEQVAGMIEVTDIVQAFEIWNVTIAGSDANVSPGGYSAKQQDEFTGQGGSPDDVWNVKLATSDPLVANLNGVLIRPTTRIVCVKQV